MASRRPTDVPSKERNEYIPHFIAKKPFYIPDEESTTSAADYLEHQRLQRDAVEAHRKRELSTWYDRGKRAGPAATKYRKGACENCGAMTHKTKECLSRPRKKGARWTGKDIQADEVVQNVELGWDAKRDRWNGYDAAEYRQVIEEYQELENLKKEVKHARGTGGETAAEAGGTGDDTAGAGADDDDDERPEDERYAEESDMRKVQSTATRNLRIREDTAKYLLNLDLDSAKYDPKTRSMVDMGATADKASALVAEENFVKASGDAAEFERANRMAWEVTEKGTTPGGVAVSEKVHIQANPTSTLLAKKKITEQEEKLRAERKKALLAKYGGAEHLQPTPLQETGVLENERFVEYDEAGLIKGKEKESVKSKYPEDIYINNHTSVWGSWWSNGTWGYACCHSTVKNSYCTGEEGKLAFEQSKTLLLLGRSADRPEDEAVDGGDAEADREQDRRRAPPPPPSSQRSTLKKRTLQELTSGVSEAELEAYKKQRNAADDPMKAFAGKDDLL
ncbi:mRNA splicing protein [Ascosphaera acerosa]|nr:mRNA splicing protein [Ascosphaera acerosa]